MNTTKFQPFLMERWMSKYEREVEYNLSESGIHPLRLNALLDNQDAIDRLLATDLGYPHVNGTPALRELIATSYAGATADNILVTVGAAEANYISIRTLLSTGDEIVIMLPNYRQVWGIATNHGFKVQTFRLREANSWAPDLQELKEKVSPKTKLIALCNPNNPTGAILSEAEMDAIVAEAERAGAWILADEVYRGTERLTEQHTPSFYGRYDRVLAVGGLSKAYGLPGLRIGWVVGPVDILDQIWARHEYVAISATILANELAALALSPDLRPRLVQRARESVRHGYAVLEDWLSHHDNTLHCVPPRAAAIAFIRYQLDINSTAFAERLRREKSVLLVPGDHFGMDRYVRICFGQPREQLLPALDRIHELIVELEHHPV